MKMDPGAAASEVAPSEAETRRFRRLRICCESSAIAVVILGCLVLIGWAFRIEILMTVFPQRVTMKVNTALGLIFAAISLWLLLPGESRTRRGQFARFLALLVVLVGAATLTEYLFDIDLQIDQLLTNDPKGSIGTSSPGRMAPTSATAFMAIGLALILLDWKTRRGRSAAQLLSLWAALIAMVAFTGYVYNATALYRILMYTQIALHTVIGLFLLSAGIFFARPRTGIARDLTGDGSGSVMARRLLPAVLLLPIILGWIRLQGQSAGLYGTELGVALHTTASVVAFAILVWLSARKMNVEHDQRSIAEVGIRELNAELEQRVAERTETLEVQATVLTEQAALLDLAQDAIIVRDMHGRIVFWNRGAETMYGFTETEALGRDKSELLRTERPGPIQDIEALLLDQGHWEGETVQRKRDGTRMIVASRWALQREADGTPVRTLTINNDITAQRQMEARLRQSHKMEAVGQLAGGVAHEFNNLLQALMSMAAIVRFRAGTPEVAKIGTEMETHIKHGANLTQQLLLFSRGQAIEMAELDLREQVQKASILLRRLVPENIRIVVETSAELLSAGGDAGQMQQVLLNLAINARDAMPSGGTLTLRAGSCDGGIFMEVEDTGQGLDQSVRAHLFEPFFTTKELGKGTGLGLAVVHGIVEQHGGRMQVESRVGDGSRFRVILPVVLHKGVSTPKPVVEPDVFAGCGRVLLVEDEAGVREGITVLLEMLGYEVTAVGSGEEAIAMPSEPVPDLLLSDVTLPGIAGSAMAEQLCGRWPSLKVVLMSGYFEDEALLTTINRRGWHFLQKPFEMTDLTSYLKSALARGSDLPSIGSAA